MSNYKFILIFAGVVFIAATLTEVEKRLIDINANLLIVTDEINFRNKNAVQESKTEKVSVGDQTKDS